MGSGPTVGHYVFSGWDLPTKYSWMHSGAGIGAATATQDAVSEMGARLSQSGETLNGILGQLAGVWAGQAATQAGSAMQRSASEIGAAGASTTSASANVGEMGESFSTAQRNVPAPNEVPTGWGDLFLYGGAEAIEAASFGVFEPQSPLHAAMEQRKALDEQANRALTTHMTTSRGGVESMQPVAAPAPMALAGALAASRPGGGSVDQASGFVPSIAGAGSPVGTGTQGTAAPGSVAPAPLVAGTSAPAASGGGASGAPGAVTPPSTPGTGAAGGAAGAGGSRPGAVLGRRGGTVGGFQPGAGGVGGGRSGAGRGFGLPGGSGGGRGGGTRAGGGVPGAGSGAGVAAGRGGRGAGMPGGRGGAGSFLQPAIGAARGRAGEDTEHTDRYAQPKDHIVGELPLVVPPVIGETPYEEELRREREAEQDRR